MKDLRKLSEIDAVIEKAIKLDISFNASIQNFTYNDYWVNEIQRSYFDKRITKLDKKIEKVIDKNDKGHIAYLQGITQNIKTKLEELSELKLDDLKDIDYQKQGWDVYLNYPHNPPEDSSLELWLPQPETGKDDRHAYVLQIVGSFYELSYDEVSTKTQEELNSILVEKHDLQDDELQLVYSKAHLIYIIQLHGKLLKELFQKFQSILNLIFKLSKYENGDFSLGSNEVRKKKGKLFFKGRKYQLAYIFKFLYDYDYISGSVNQNKADTPIKEFINESETYYFENDEPVKIEKFGKEWSKVGKHAENHVYKEIEFIEELMVNLEKRIEHLKNTD
ncbi:hypothetical protein [Patiriisocius hiemis]|uniref:Uncharacterized protein n=1 Tax=Patiriisocius hiemis TaxID=3075604 RepID=A0ABU2Y9T3_9FLAO|nr:hypothetical protein [Constantimarinum sp. W242]MDT0554492.1 hypothetical protein [Constantimarinum sp. W242]